MDIKPFLLTSLFVTTLCVNCTRQSQDLRQNCEDSALMLELLAHPTFTDAKSHQVSHLILKLDHASLMPKLVIRNPTVSTKPVLDDGLEVVIAKNGKRYFSIYEGRESRINKKWLWKRNPASYYYVIDWKYLVPVDAVPINQSEYENRQFGPYEVQAVLKHQGKKVLESNTILIEYIRE